MEDVLLQRESDNNFDVHHQGTLCRELWNLRTEGTMCDVILDVSGEYLLGHRVILSACSPYLKTCCLNPEAISQDGLVQIKLENYSFKVCLKLFEFLYTGKPVDFAGPALDEFKRLCAEWDVVGITESVQLENGSIKTVSQDDSQVDASGYHSHPLTNLFDEYKVMHIDNQSQPKIENTEGGEDGHESNHDELWEPPRKVHAKRGRPRKSSSKTRKRPHSNDQKLPGRKRGRPPKNKSTENLSGLPLSTLEKNKMPNEEPPQYDSDTDVDDSASTVRPQCESSESHTNDGLTDNADAKVTDDEIMDELDDAKPKTLLRQTQRKRATRTRQVIAANELGMFICPVCDAEFETKGKLQYHRKSVHKNKRQGWCKICKIKFSDRNQLKAHDVEHHWKEGMELPTHYICETSESPSATDMSSSESESSPIQPTAASSDLATTSTPCYKSAILEMPSAETSSNNDSTQGMHSNSQAEGCNYMTYNRKSFNAHKLFVHQSERSICDLCGKSLKSQASLKQHKLLVHVIALSKDYPCTSCDKVFKSYCGLTRHQVNIHEGGGKRDKQICTHCGKTCENASSMIEHLYKKHDVTPPPGKTGYKCKYCDDFKTTKIRDIRNHELRHKAEKQFSCDLCAKSYPTNRELTRHKLLHTDKCKIWKCQHCPYTTKYGTAALRSHIQVKHEENRPWVCTICSYSTKLKGNLHKHIRNVHKCQVKTKWTIPKLVEGESCDRYVERKATTSKDPPLMKKGAEETANSDNQTTSSEAEATDILSSENLVSNIQNNIMYNPEIAKPLLTQGGMPQGNSWVQKPQPHQLDILSQLTSVAPHMDSIHGDHVMYSGMGVYPGIDPKLN